MISNKNVARITGDVLATAHNNRKTIDENAR